MAHSDADIVRVLFRTIDGGDLRKMDAVSNDAPTGGGARDLRFRPSEKFLPFFQRMFPEVVLKTRQSERIETFSGPVVWTADGQEESGVMAVWPPTDARPGECRIATVHRFGFSGLVKRDPSGGRSVFMLFQQRSGVVRVYFATETSLRTGNWNSAVREFAVAWLDTGHSSAFLDLEADERFPSA